MKRWITLGFILLIAISLSHADEITSATSSDQVLSPPPQMYTVLERITDEISHELFLIMDENQKSALSLQGTGISGESAELVLQTKLSNVTHGHSSLVISPENIITAAAPAMYTDLIGTNLSHQPETRYANEKKEPVISDVFYLEEGFYGISVSYPVFAEDGGYLGYTDITIRPEEFFRSVISNITEESGYEVMIVQSDGTVVYETDEIEIGKNIMTDQVYDSPEMRSASQALLENETGSVANYTFWDKGWNKQVLRQAVWDTISLDNQFWRVAVIRDLEDNR